MPKLERGWYCAWQSYQELFEQCRIGFQIRRQLKKQRSQFSRLRERFNVGQKPRQEVFGLFQALDVRDDLVCLNTQFECRRRLRNPLLRCCFFQQLPKGEIDLNGIELRGVILEKLCLCKFLGVEIRLP